MKSAKEIGPSRAMRSRRRSDEGGHAPADYSFRRCAAAARDPATSRPLSFSLSACSSRPDGELPTYEEYSDRRVGFRRPSPLGLESRRRRTGSVRAVDRMEGPAPGRRRSTPPPSRPPLFRCDLPSAGMTARRGARRSRADGPSAVLSPASGGNSRRSGARRRRGSSSFAAEPREARILLGLFLSGTGAGGGLGRPEARSG